MDGKLVLNAGRIGVLEDMFNSGGSATAMGQGGLQIWVRTGVASKVTVNPISERIMSIIASIKGKRCLIVNGHAPIEDAAEHEKNSFWRDLVEHCLHCQAKFGPDSIILCIDANAE
eukprot:10275648-Karenia_brevis.AAC.1